LAISSNMSDIDCDVGVANDEMVEKYSSPFMKKKWALPMGVKTM